MKTINSKILPWIERAQIKTSKGIPFEFTKAPYLLDPLTDWHPNQGMNKGAQVRISETFGVLKAAYATAILGLSVIYTLPTDAFVQKFVSSKVRCCR